MRCDFTRLQGEETLGQVTPLWHGEQYRHPFVRRPTEQVVALVLGHEDVGDDHHEPDEHENDCGTSARLSRTGPVFLTSGGNVMRLQRVHASASRLT